MEILIKVGDFIEFNEMPDAVDFDIRGVVTEIDPNNNLVFVMVPNWGLVKFDLDGSSWAHCGAFKREYRFID